jgi:hypothetical protein
LAAEVCVWLFTAAIVAGNDKTESTCNKEVRFDGLQRIDLPQKLPGHHLPEVES